jgi:anti-sigma B factor antagonist
MSVRKAFAARVEHAFNQRAVVVSLVGNLDPTAVEELEPKIQSLFKSGLRRFVFDLTHLSYTGSLGLRLFVGLNNQVRGEGAVVLCQATDAVRTVLEITKLTKLMRHFPTVAEALDACAA